MTVTVGLTRPNPHDRSPLYLQLVQRIATSIELGQWPSGGVLPGERQLCEALQVSRTTLRKAIQVLTERGLIVPRQGSGNYVSQQVTQGLTQLTSFSDDMRARGWEPGARVLSAAVHPADALEATALQLDAKDRVLRLVRLRMADGVPLALERATVSAQFLPDPAVVGSSLYAALEARGLRPIRAVQHLQAAAALPMDAEHLGIAVGTPVMHTVRNSFLADNRPIEFTRSVYRGDRYNFVADLR
jgi:GntR family transcriptional regulator